MSTEGKLVLTGIQPSSGQVHLGNYLGAMKRMVKLQETNPMIMCIVDMHALTSVEKGAELRENTKSLGATYLALGLDKESTIVFKQSDVPEVCELTWYFACQFPLGLLERATAFKDKKGKNEQVNSGLLFYPILMAADILLYKAQLVPVGKDQKQHLEMSREIAEKFNYKYGTSFTLPEPLIDEDLGLIPGLDGRKMSKSYNNYIGLFESEKDILKKAKKIITDSKEVADVKNPDECNVFKLYRFFANQDEVAEMRESYLKGGMGYGTAKVDLARVINREVAPLREKYEYYMAHPSKIYDCLEVGAEKARKIATETLREVRDLIGISK